MSDNNLTPATASELLARLQPLNGHAIARWRQSLSFSAVDALLDLADRHPSSLDVLTLAGVAMRAGATPCQVRRCVRRISQSLLQTSSQGAASALLKSLADAARSNHGPAAYYDYRGEITGAAASETAKWPFPKEFHACAWLRLETAPSASATAPAAVSALTEKVSPAAPTAMGATTGMRPR